MNADRWATLTLALMALVFLLVAVQALVAPGVLLAPVEIGLHTASAHAEIRAGYGGCFGGLAVAFVAGARAPVWRRPALALGAVVLGLFVAGRLLSLGVDGPPNPYSWAMLGLEAVGFVSCAVLWRGSAPRDR